MDSGYAVSAVRAAVYFGGHGTAGPLWVLAAWAVAGVTALALVTARRRRRASMTLVPLGPVMDAAATAAGGLVVGFDNSEPARRALGWAARQLIPPGTPRARSSARYRSGSCTTPPTPS